MENNNLFVCKSAILFALIFTCSFDVSSQNIDSRNDREASLRLPKTDLGYKSTSAYIEDVPDADYRHASETAYERFRDIKYSIRIHWGVYVLQPGTEASWNFLKYTNEKKQEYQELYKLFNPVDFDAEKWITDFSRWGMQAFAFTSKHHDGFSMWDTKTRVKRRFNYLTQEFEDCDLAYSIMDAPIKRDIVKELCDATAKFNANCKEDYRKIKVDLYFSHPDFYDTDFRAGPAPLHPLSMFEITQLETDRFISRHREQLRELLTNYGHVDMICLDGLFDQGVWPQIKETVKLMRKWSPETMFRARGIGNYGDYYQPEHFVPKDIENSGMPWMSICKLGKTYSYEPIAENYQGAQWVIHNLIDCVAKGGSFMVSLGPDEKGNFHPQAIEQLNEVGDWLKVNGKGIYETRPCEVWHEGTLYFTRTKDHKNVYALTEQWPEREVIIKSIQPKKGSKVYLLGYKKPLKWTPTNEGIKVEIPQTLKTSENRPCKYAWVFQFENNQK